MTIAKNYDDNRDGAVLTKIAQGDLVRVPVPNTAQTSTSGTGTANHGGTTLNPDGSLHGYTLTAPAGLGNMAALRFTVFGRVVGIRFQRASATTAPFTVKVDGVIHGVRNTQARRNAQPATITDVETLYIVEDDLLTDGPHTVEVSLASEASTSRSITVFGHIAEASKGYSPYPQVGLFSSTPQAVPTTAGSITASGFPVRAFQFVNTSAAARTVTLKIGANVFDILQVPITAVGVPGVRYDFGMPVDVSGMTVLADAAGVNLFALQGGRAR